MFINVHQILMNAIPTEHHWKLRLFQQWDRVIGRLKDKVRIEKIQDETIILAVSHPSWAQELLMMSSILRKKINDALQENRIKQIRFSHKSFTSRITASQESLQPTIFDAINHQEAVSLNEHDKASLQQITNKDLQYVLEAFYLTCKKRSLANKEKAAGVIPETEDRM